MIVSHPSFLPSLPPSLRPFAQVLFPDKDAAEMAAWHEKAKGTLPGEANEIIGKFLARKKMQDKYINQVRRKSWKRREGGRGSGWSADEQIQKLKESRGDSLKGKLPLHYKDRMTNKNQEIIIIVIPHPFLPSIEK